MNRHAVLIDSGKADRDKVVHGSHLDIRRMSGFLVAPIGGAWRREEIHIVEEPTIERLLEILDRANAADYFFFFFTGHGGYIGRHVTVLLARTNPCYLARRSKGSGPSSPWSSMPVAINSMKSAPWRCRRATAS